MIKRVDSGGQIHLVTNIRKPRKWRRYEYLQSSGTLWIDTGVALSLTDKFEFETDFTYSPTNNRACPFYGTENYLTGFMAQYHYTNNNLFVTYIKGSLFGGANISIAASSRMYSKTIIDVPNKAWATIYNTTSANGTYSNLITDTTSTVKFFGNDLYNKYVAKCYYFKIKINNVLVRDFVPAQYNGQYGMWDLVEDKFYPNKGTGTFTVGPEMKNYDEIDEVRKTTSLLPSGVELYDYLEGTGNNLIDTGFKLKQNVITTFDVDCQWGSGSLRGIILGNYRTNPNKAVDIEISASSLIIIYNYPNPSTGYNFSVGANTRCHVILNTSSSSLYGSVNGTQFSYNVSQSGDYTNNYSLFNDYRNFTRTIRYYNVKILEDNVLKKNLVPCTYLGEPGMWDTVENKFYRNQGIGLFTLGNKVTLKEYEYLESSKTQWIDTNFYPNLDSGSELKVQILPSSEAYSKLLYTDYTSTNEGSILWGWDINNSNRFRAAYYKNLKIITSKVGKVNNNDVYLLKIDKNIYSINGITVLTNSTINFLSSSTVKLFARKNLNGSITNQSAMRLYYCKLYNDNQLVRDFIPVSYNGEYGLWDKVEWKFYGNAGTGSFTLGPEKKSGTYPVWTPIEYLQGDGVSCYIDTGFYPNNNTHIKTNILIPTVGNGTINVYGAAGSSYTDRTFELYDWSNLLLFNYGNGTNYLVYPPLNTWLEIEHNKNRVSCNETTGTITTNSFNSPTTMYLFSTHRSNATTFGNKSNIKMQYFKLWDNDTLIRDFIPVRIGTTGYMFDRVTGKMYGNSGTGKFILGPDINL